VVNFDLYLRMKDFLARDPELGSIGFPHDIWADIVVRKDTSRRIAKFISFVESKVPYKRRARIIRDAFRSVFGDVEDEFKVLGDKVAKERFSVAYYARLNRDLIGELSEEEVVRRDAEEYSDLTVSRIYLMTAPKPSRREPLVLLVVGDREYKFRALEFEVGRNPGGANVQVRYGDQIIDTPILDMTVSRKHLRVFVEGKKIYVMDLGSRNGTWVDSKKIEPNEKIAVDEVSIGGQGLKIKIKVK